MTPQPFKLLDLQPIHRNGLAGQGRVQMGSGMILRVNFMRSKTEPKTIFPFPAANKGPGNTWVQVVEFASQDLLRIWQASVMAAVGSRMAELLDPEPGVTYDSF